MQKLSKRAFKKLSSKPSVVFCFILLGLYMTVAIAGFFHILPDFQLRVGTSYELPRMEIPFIFGTDVFGRSVFYKVLAGTKTAVTMGFLVTIIAVPIGFLLGALAGFYGGIVDTCITWLYSVVSSVPGILMLIAISYSLGKGLMAVCIAMASTYWVGLCRLIRSQFMKHKDSEYVLASKLLGANDCILMFKHILPNTIHLGIVTSSLMVLSAIKAEVMLTYIGVGIQDGASWGAMITAAPGELTTGIWWPLTAVVTVMFAIIYALNITGDALRDALDPKLY